MTTPACELVDHPPRRTFDVARCLGRGGFGEVYEAAMTSAQGLQTTVALKVLRRDLAPGSLAVQRLRDEGRLLARVPHPAIVVVHDLVELEGRVALVTEYVRGEDLEACLREPDPIPLRALLEVCAQVAGALAAAWRTEVGQGSERRPLRLAHRDVKPSNVRIGHHGEVKLLDFGIARTDELTREAKTDTDMLVGSPPYMAPERFLDGDVRSASDVHAVGAMLVERLLGERLFDVPVPVLAGMAVIRERYDAFLEERLAGLDAPPAVIELAAAALAYDPEVRPSALELARRCEALADEVGGVSLSQWCRGRPWPEPRRVRGELEGRTLTEGSLEPVAAPEPVAAVEPPGEPTVERPAKPPPPPAPGTTDPTLVQTRPRSRRTAWWLGGMSAVGAMGVASVVAVGLLAIGVAWWAPWDRAPAEVEPAPAPEPAPAVVVPAPAPRGEPAPAPSPPPEERPAPAPPPEPAAQPAPAPIASPAPAGVPVDLEAEGDVVAALTVQGERVVLPAAVPPGRWPLDARFNHGTWRSTDLVVDVASGTPVTVRCGSAMERCVIAP